MGPRICGTMGIRTVGTQNKVLRKEQVCEVRRQCYGSWCANSVDAKTKVLQCTEACEVGHHSCDALGTHIGISEIKGVQSA